MRALTVLPGRAGTARLEEVPEPPPGEGSVLVQTLLVGVCGTDHEIISGAYGWSPPGKERLILGHESLGRVLEAPAGSGLAPGDLVVGIVRRPDPVPCYNCAAGEFDMCRNGLYTERGIKELDGFCSERFRIEPEYAVKVDPSLDGVGVLLEPASVLAKAWEHIEYLGQRAVWKPRRVLVTGAGPVGLLAALMGRQRNLDVAVFDRVAEGPKVDLVRRLGASYHTSSLPELISEADIVLECTGVGRLVLEAMEKTPPAAIVCLLGLAPGGKPQEVDVASLNRNMVLENDVVFGSVNANRRHYEKAAEALAKADLAWLQGMVTRRVPLDRWQDALEHRPTDVKTVIDLAGKA